MKKSAIARAEIIKMNRADLEEHFDQFLALFAENTRSHVIDQVIEDRYILFKARELFDHLKKGKAVLFGAFDRNRLISLILFSN